MKDRVVRSSWGGGYRCEVEAGGFTLLVDEPASAGGTNTGPQPTDLLLASLASCVTLAIAYAASKRNVEIWSIDVVATGTYDGQRFSAIDVVAEVGCDPSELDRLLLVANQACYVGNTLKESPKIVVTGRLRDG